MKRILHLCGGCMKRKLWIEKKTTEVKDAIKRATKRGKPVPDETVTGSHDGADESVQSGGGRADTVSGSESNDSGEPSSS